MKDLLILIGEDPFHHLAFSCICLICTYHIRILPSIHKVRRYQIGHLLRLGGNSRSHGNGIGTVNILLYKASST